MVVDRCVTFSVPHVSVSNNYNNGFTFECEHAFLHLPEDRITGVFLCLTAWAFLMW